MKAGIVYEELGQFSEALKVYNRIKTDYSKSTEARDSEKHIARVNLSL